MESSFWGKESGRGRREKLMDNDVGGGFGFWAPPPPPTFAPPFPAAASHCSHYFPDQLMVPDAGATASGPHQHPHGQQHHHLTCLKLGKRQYFGSGDDEAVPNPRGHSFKKERPAASTTTTSTIPRCQVEGCDKALTDCKEYHRRHKVCEIHSKSPCVVVHGSEQRFCQQCSRFHGMSEFDDAKRSCRRRLAGHNERRRKSNSIDGSVNPSSATLEHTILGSRFQYLSQTSPGRALSLLSSKASPWISTAELSSRSSAALRELIAENRATVLARQLFSSSGWHSGGYCNQSIISFTQPENQETSQGTTHPHHCWRQFQESGSHLTLDLMQSHNTTSFELISGRNQSKEEVDEEECCAIWESLGRTHVV